MMARVSGKVAIVTGGAAGLGRAQAQRLSDEGAHVIVTDIDEAAGRVAIETMPGALSLPHDVRNESDWKGVIRAATDHFGRLDILVNNAGIVRFASIEDCTLDEYEMLSSVMSTGTFLGCKHAIGAMAASGNGSIINIASVAAMRGNAAVPAYSAAKGAVLSLSRSVIAHCQHRGYPIRVNVVLPGSHDTAMTRAAYATLPEEQVARVRQTQGRPEDVADLVLFLASDESRQINGAEIVIDQGRTVQ